MPLGRNGSDRAIGAVGLRAIILAGLATIAVAALSAALAPGGTGTGRRVVYFLAPAAVTWSIVTNNLRRGMAGVRQPTAWGWAMRLTLLRGLLLALVAGFVLLPPVGVVAWMPAALYAAAVIGDRYDGVLARRLGEVTPLGAYLDGATDALGLLVAPAVAVAWGRLPPWYLAVGAAYYLFQTGIWIRRRLGLPVHPERVVANRPTRFFAGLQMVLVAVSLPPVLNPRLTSALATALMMPPLALFVRDWLRVTGHLEVPGGS